ncbi:hypothetical protein HDU97_008634 [Phlyctochytrium planicorne]|nr:hypothetical protein HDU97_008634 [Phlyctochytrium planicorne]
MGYQEAFASTKARTNLDQISNRLRKARVLDSEVTDFFRERIAVEERYIADLLKLSKKSLTVEKEQLGEFSEVWDKVALTVSILAEAHRTLCSDLNEALRSGKARVDKDYSYAQQRILESDLQKLNKEYDDELKKLKKSDGESKGLSFFKKLKGGSSRESTGTAENMAGIQKAGEGYVTKLKPLLEKFQLYDETRLAVLVDTLRNCTQAELNANVKVSSTATIAGEYIEKFNVTEAVENFCRKKGTNSENAQNDTDSLSSRKNSVVAPAPPVLAPSRTLNKLIALQPALVDSEGFTIPPPSAVASKWPPPPAFDSDEEETDTNSSTQPKLRVAIKDRAITDSPEAAVQTFQNVAATLQMPGSTPNRQSVLDASAIFQNMTIAPPKRQNISIDATITETINLLLRDGEIEKLLVSGEVSVLAQGASTDSGTCRAVLQGADGIEKVVVNSDYASHPDPSDESTVELNLGRIASAGSDPVTVLKYKLKIDPSDYEQYAPVFFTSFWKRDPTHSSFLLAYQFNDDVKARARLNGLSFLVSLQGSDSISSVQTKPTGIWNPEKKALLWKVDEDDSGPGETHKLIARVESPDDLASSQIAVRFTTPALCSEIGFEVLDQEGVLLRNLSSVTTTGKYGSF